MDSAAAARGCIANERATLNIQRTREAAKNSATKGTRRGMIADEQAVAVDARAVRTATS